jgi:hypothetical protein
MLFFVKPAVCCYVYFNSIKRGAQPGAIDPIQA